MPSPRTLIIGSTYLDTKAKAELASLWGRLNRKLNPDVAMLVVDSASPIDPIFLTTDSGAEIYRFKDNLGHGTIEGSQGDGSMRAMFTGLRSAIKFDYEFAVFIECDILLAKPVAPIVNRLWRKQIGAAFPYDCTYSFIENGLGFYDLTSSAIRKFIQEFDWIGPRTELSERKFERLLEDELFILPLRGVRNDLGVLTRANIKQRCFYGLDYLTHSRDMGLYDRFLEINGIKL